MTSSGASPPSAVPAEPARVIQRNPGEHLPAEFDGEQGFAERIVLDGAGERHRTRDQLAALRNPPPGQAAIITNQTINALNAPVEAAHRELDEAENAAAAVPAWIRLGETAPDMARLEAEVKQITHAIRMAAYNAETTLARALGGHYARANDEGCALIREALLASGDIIPGSGELLIRLDPLTAPRRTQTLAALCDQLTQAEACYPGTELVLRYEVKPNPA